ncbi:hypothetical protein VIBC2010_12429 [Vibrio caribbeanicus ATCC BAA-2122]|uniref:Uncharacterized protein n=1 Tax=Vibrio caribbeanicus ATCC BAA-2122 TaxID=796620 RepID=E3BL29_9VIBR|nr:hypothetical protein VIBC2010_12429 [Vibrio caribbeanicus ATCC BAA-2122]
MARMEKQEYHIDNKSRYTASCKVEPDRRDSDSDV